MQAKPVPIPKCRRFRALVLSLLFALFGPAPAPAQVFTPLIQFTNEWKYDLSGQELGSAWRTNDFDDSAWPSGRGLLGFDDPISVYLPTVPSGILTVLPVSGSVTTFYFRTTFEFTGSTQAMTLVATNLVDDGCAIWLNGRLAGGVRMPANFIANTFFNSPTVEGQPDVVALTNFLRQGVNQLAVEVHQAAANSADVMFGMKLVTIQQTPLVITNQPRSFTVTAGDPVTLSVGVAGGPVSYRWLKDGLPLPNATNAAYVIPAAALAHSGDYRVVCSNTPTLVTSEVARVTVLQDLTGPQLLRAVADYGFGSNRIIVWFSEPLFNSGSVALPYSPRNTTNYTVTRLSNGRSIEVTNALYSPAIGTMLVLDSSTPDWVSYDDYVLTVNGIADVRTNVIAPGSTVAVSWQITTNVLPTLGEWDFHPSALFDPGIYDEPWFEPSFSPGVWWGRGFGPFYGGAVPASICGSGNVPQTSVGWQPEPVLFRTSFLYPTDWPTEAVLRLRYSLDDALVLYLNGAQIFRTNVAGALGDPVRASTRSLTAVTGTLCGTNNVSVTNLRPGLNWLAAAVPQSVVAGDSDMIFALGVEATALLSPTLPEQSPPSLEIDETGPGTFRLSWTGGGYALESSTNLVDGGSSYPFGPWLEVPRMSNPYTWSPTNETPAFFRLKK